MSSDRVVPPDTVHRQRLAADPAASAWVSANAGAGKTRVLADRVIRLLLDDTPPSRILCLTFTKAAAAEMTNRVFRQLGAWVTMPDADLARALADLAGAKPKPALLQRARRLFARAVETPGGLKIETIHAFCERILHLVPFEANVPARFTVLDDSQSGEILAAARSRILTEAASEGPRSRALAAALDIVASYAAGEGLTALIDAAVADERVPGEPEGRERAVAALRDALGVPEGLTSAEVGRVMLEGGVVPPAEWPAFAAELRRTGRPSDADQASLFEAALAGRRAEVRLAAYRSVFFTERGFGSPKKSLATKGVAEPVCAALKREQDRLAEEAERMRAVETVERTDALFLLAGAVRAEAERHKERLGALDFGDLIGRTLALLDREDAAAWVLYKLDRGIDHVLVDEAQDTNPEQWRILKRLTEEFTAGEGRARQAPRTVFAVGDPKQSIYSFQGADPRLFEEGRRHWMGRTKAAKLAFADVRLDLSFRSAPAILHAVDHTFGVEAHFRGLSFDVATRRTSHASARPSAPGEVEIWDTVVDEKAGTDPDAWELPVDEPERTAPAVVVAGNVAKAIRRWTTLGDDAGRVWRPGEVMILVRSRGPAFFAVIRALKTAGVPVAGADRFDIGEHIAVNDLVAIGGAALLPRNDLVLAAALKTPLVGLDDEDLVRISAGRGERETLAEALAGAASVDEKAKAGHEALMRWRALARDNGPFGFYAALLGPEGGRRRLVARLGGEAADAIDAFLTYAQTAELGPETPSLTTFLSRFETAEHTIKRDLDAAGGEVTVMTVHGAKGLEKPLVVVLDACEVHGREPPLVPLALGPDEVLPVWSPGKLWDCDPVAKAREAAKHGRLEEHNRLLYVAMTRAADKLVLAPFLPYGRETEQTWCNMVRRGFADAAAELARVERDWGAAHVWRSGGPRLKPDDRRPARPVPEAIPDWLSPLAAEPGAAPPLRPSRAARQPFEGAAEARRRGTLVHALVDHLASFADERRDEAAAVFLRARAARLDPDAHEAIAREALGIVRHPDLAALFGPGSRGEAPIAGTVGAAREVLGQVDRLVVAPDEVVFAEIKTGEPAPSGRIPPAYLAQIALYRAVLAEAYPGKRVRALLVWAQGPRIVEPGKAALDRALAEAVRSSA